MTARQLACGKAAEKLGQDLIASAKDSRLIKFILAALILLLLFGGRSRLARLKSPKTLNMADRLLGAGSDMRQLAQGQLYGRGPRQGLDIWGPSGLLQNLPVVIFFYGGGWEAGNRADYGFVGRALAARGFLVVLPDYRLAPKAHFPDFVEDCAAAAAWVQQHIGAYGGDPSRVALMGHSAGAYNAAMLALDPQWLHRAGGSASQLRGVVTLAGPFDFLPLEKGGQAERAMGRYRPLAKTQPIHFAHAAAPPFFVASGADDDVVKPRNSSALATAIQQAGGDAQLKLYPAMGHAGIVMALAQSFRGKGDVLADTADFLRRVTLDPHPNQRF